jgi:hypothetical protein
MKTKREDLMTQVRKHSNLALIYADDGAFATAANIFEECAALMLAERVRRWSIMNPGIPLTPPAKRRPLSTSGRT